MKTQYSNRIKRKVLRKQASTRNSITCGTENPASVGCVFYEMEGGEVATVFRGGRWHEGHEGMLHGGITASILDEVMGRANRAYDNMMGEPGGPVVTAEMTVRYLKPVMSGELMTAFGRIDRREGRRRFASGEIVNEIGEVMASATGVYVSVSADYASGDIKPDRLGGALGPEDIKEL